MVERDDEIERLGAAVSGLRAGRSGRVLLTGRRGSGVSALLGTAVRAARAAGLQVVHARCALDEADLALGTVLELARSLADDPPVAVASPGPAASALLPGLCSRFVAAARRRPLVIAVDDVQWADPLSRTWLWMMMQRSRHAPILVICAGQSSIGHWVPGPALDQLVEPEDEVAVRALGRQGVQALIADRYEGPVSLRFSRAAMRATGGAPGVLRPALDRFLASGLSPIEAHIPVFADCAGEVNHHRLQDAVAALPPPALILLQAMAICGDALGPDLMTSLIPNDRARHVQILAGAGLIVEGPDGEPSPLPDAGKIALARLSTLEYEALAARAIRFGDRAGVSETRLAALLMSAPPTGRAGAGDILARVGQQRRLAAADAAATAMLVRALREPLSPSMRRRLQVELGMSQVVSRPDAADRRLHQVLLAADAPLDDESVLRAADLLLARGDARASYRALAAAVRRAAGSGPLPRPLLALAWVAGAEAAGDPALPMAPLPPLQEAPADPVESAVASWLVTARGTEWARARALARYALIESGAEQPFVSRILAARVLLLTEDVTEAVIGLDDVLMDARRCAARAAVGLALLQRAWCELRRGNPAQAGDDLAEAGAQLPADSWHPRVRATFPALQAALHLESGDVDAAEAVLASPEAQARPRGDAGLAWSQLCCARGVIAMLRADPVTALRHFQAAGRALVTVGCINPTVSPWQWLSAAAQLAAGDRPAAERTIRHTLGRAQRWGAPQTLLQAHLFAAQILGGNGGAARSGNRAADAPYDAVILAALSELPSRSLSASRSLSGLFTGSISLPVPDLVAAGSEAARGRDTGPAQSVRAQRTAR